MVVSHFLITLHYRSESGVVNIYNRTDCLISRDPKPIKVVNNLLTQCNSAKFNSTSQLLAMASSSSEKAVKLVSNVQLKILFMFNDLII